MIKTHFLIFMAMMATPAMARDYPALAGKPVVDAANIIPDDHEAALNDTLFAYEKRTGHQLMVATVPTLDGDSIENYAQGYFREVKLGAKGRDDGALFLIAPTERKMRIHTGYGMRALLTDAQAIDILDQDVKPLFKDGDMVGGIEAGVIDIVRATTPLTAQELAMKAREEANAKAAALAFWGSVKDFFMSVLAIIGIGAGGFGLYRVATIPARRRAARETAEAEEQRLAEIERLRAERAEQNRIAQEAERARVAAEERKRLKRIALAKKAREDMLATMTPDDRASFLAKEEADAEAERERVRLAAEAAAERAAELERQRIAAWEAGRPAREAAERRKAEEERQEEERRERRRKEDQRRREANDSAWSSSSSSSSSSWDSGSSFSGGGGDSGGGGASSSW